MNETYSALIRHFPLFQGFSDHGTESLVERGVIRQFPGGAMLFREGDQPDSVLLVLFGSLEVFVEREGQRLALLEARPGAIVGELAVLCGLPRSAGLQTKERTVVLRWEPEDFRRLLVGNPQFSRRIMGEALRILVEKERELIDSLVRAGRDSAIRGFGGQAQVV